MSNYKNAMRRMRKYAAEVKKNYDSRGRELDKLKELKGSPFYDRQEEEINRKIEAERIRLGKSVKKDMTAILEDMRENVNRRITKAPTPEISACLSILGQLESLTPTEVSLYAQQMADCPLAMRRLNEIAEKHEIRIRVPDIEEMLRAVDVLEGNFATFIGGYTGDIDKAPTSVRQLYQYFQGDEDYTGTPAKSTDNADAAFWRDIVQIGTPAMLDSEAATGETVKAELFFKDLDGLLAYMDKQTAGLEGQEREDKQNKIIAECPAEYGGIYRHYKATGAKLPLNSDEDKP